MKDKKLENLEAMINMVRFEKDTRMIKPGQGDTEVKEWINRIGHSFYELVRSSKKFNEGGLPQDELAHRAIEIATYALKLAEILSVKGKDE
jgi:hypothetical protein